MEITNEESKKSFKNNNNTLVKLNERYRKYSYSSEEIEMKKINDEIFEFNKNKFQLIETGTIIFFF